MNHLNLEGPRVAVPGGARPFAILRVEPDSGESFGGIIAVKQAGEIAMSEQSSSRPGLLRRVANKARSLVKKAKKRFKKMAEGAREGRKGAA